MIIMKKLLVFLVVLFLGIFITLDITTQAFALPQDMQERINATGPDEPISSTKLSIKYYLPDNLAAISAQIMGAETDEGDIIIVGAIPTTNKVIAHLATNPPVQTGAYIADVLQNTGLAQPAYAQGIGFSALTPVLRIWKAFRNIAYFFIIIFFIIAGFMIMFRKQIDHSTVVTLQMALPKIVTTLILITFSYAIAGFVVDMIYLVIFVFTEILQTFGVLVDASTARNVIFGKSVIHIGTKYLMGTGELAGGAATAVTSLIEQSLNIKKLDWLLSGLAYVIIAIAILIALFRTLFALIGAYVGIIISVIFAPIQLLFNALPGSNTFGSWIKTLVANAAVFPAVAIMILIGASLVGVNHESDDSLGINIQEGVGWGKDTEGWIPPLVGQDVSSGAASGISGVIGLGMIMLLPEIAKMIKEVLEVKDVGGDMALGGISKGSKIVGAPLGWIGSAAIQGAQLGIGSDLYRKHGERRAARQKRRLEKDSKKIKPMTDSEITDRLGPPLQTTPQAAQTVGEGKSTFRQR